MRYTPLYLVSAYISFALGITTTTSTSTSTGTTSTLSVAQASFSIPFAEQNGAIRYAPMQKVPPTSITKKTKTPLNPTSPYTLATTFMAGQTSIQTTVTQAITWGYSQEENPASSASAPTDEAMKRFLNRWKD